MKTKQFIPAATLALAITFILTACGEQNGDNPSSSLCGNVSYDPSLYRCEMGEVIGKCMGKDYYTAYQQCVNGVITTTSNNSSSSSSSKYSSSSISSAGQISSSSSESISSSSSVIPSSSSTVDNSSSSEITLYCYYESPDNCWLMPTMDDCAYGTLVHDCSKPPEGIYCYYGDGICWLMPTADNCASGTLVNDCSKPPSSSSVAISSSSVASSSSSNKPTFCTGANNTSTEYCSNGTMKTYGFVTYNGKTYKTVVIGTQTWMAENLNHNVADSKCYGEGGYLDDNQILTNDEIQANCDTYGRLYNWVRAMNLPNDCNSSTCSNQISTKHKGICPTDWHIPSDADWITLINYVGGSAAGTKLKATSGWYKIINTNGTDNYGFSALPGGYGNPDGKFGFVGYEGNWWSAREYENYNLQAYFRRIEYPNEYVNTYLNNDVSSWFTDKLSLRSVRCVKD